MTLTISLGAAAVRTLTAATILSIALVVPAHTASAQLGGLVKKAKQKVEQKVDDKASAKVDAATSGDVVEFDNVILELTPERIDQVLRGLTASRRLLDGEDGSGRAALVARRDAAANERAALSDSKGKAIDAYRQKQWETERCRNELFSEARNKRSEENQNRVMSDPALQQKIIQLTQRMAQAQARGDTATVYAVQREFENMMSPGAARADTIAADAKCGREPAKPAALAEVEALDARIASLNGQIRALEEKAGAEELRESGLTARQFAMAKERLEYYMSRVKYNSRQQGFTKAELDAIGARKDDIARAL